MKPELNDPHQTALDWITIWQSELSAAATDLERSEAWSAMVSIWAGWGQAVAAYPAGTACAGEPARPAAPVASSGPAPAAAAPDERERAVVRLAARVDELERKLAAASTG